MDSPSVKPQQMSILEQTFSNTNMVILFLVLLILSLLGIHILIIMGTLLKSLVEIFGPPILNVFAMFGYSTGEFINNTADVTADVTKLGIDITNGTAHSIGNLLKDGSQGGMSEEDRERLEKMLAYKRCPSCKPEDTEEAFVYTMDSTENPIQNHTKRALSVDPTRSLMAVDDYGKCLSGQIFPGSESCLQPL